MPRNGSGTYSPPVNSWNPATNGVPATASDWQAQLNDIRDALTQSVSRDGQTIISGDLQMGGNKLTNLEPGSLPGDSLRWEQLFSQGQQADIASAATVDIGAQNTTNLNITGTTTITSFGANYNGPRFVRFAGVLTLTHSAALALPTGANITTAAGDTAVVVPNGVPATGWRVSAYQRASGEALVGTSVFPAAGITGAVAIANGGTGQTTAAAGFDALKQPATDTYTGVVELATAAEAQAGTDASRVITPLTLDQAFLGANQSLSGSGYQKFPGGLIIQWGSFASNSDDNIPIVFPIQFPVACVGVYMGGSPSNHGTSRVWSANTITNSGFNSNRDDSIDTTFTALYMAIGY